jgi:WXXGXW repeat (2 copies)
MRKSALALLGALSLLALAGMAAAQSRVAPPPPRVEAPTLQPSPNHVWVPGYWKWAGVNYEWVDGRWVKAKKDRIWVPGTWEQVGARWAWKPGRWAKPEKAKPKPKDEKAKPGK